VVRGSEGVGDERAIGIRFGYVSSYNGWVFDVWTLVCMVYWNCLYVEGNTGRALILRPNV